MKKLEEDKTKLKFQLQQAESYVEDKRSELKSKADTISDLNKKVEKLKEDLEESRKANSTLSIQLATDLDKNKELKEAHLASVNAFTNGMESFKQGVEEKNTKILRAERCSAAANSLASRSRVSRRSTLKMRSMRNRRMISRGAACGRKRER